MIVTYYCLKLEVVVYQLGIPIKNVVSVEKSEMVPGWSTIWSFLGGFDLVVGGNPSGLLVVGKSSFKTCY
ncbi:hypothetical protein K1719_028766 [Acacia pycnantha]|nr:hypothetical protein K1719_028766 [Acacia pycnantha]